MRGIVDEWVIDIKDMNPAIYKEYTGVDNGKVIGNLKYLAAEGLSSRCRIRIPLIPDFNTDADRRSGISFLQAMGFTRFDRFEYTTEINK